MKRFSIAFVIAFAAAFAAAPVVATAGETCQTSAAACCCCDEPGAPAHPCEMRCADPADAPGPETAIAPVSASFHLHLDTTAPALTGAIDGDHAADGRWRLAARPEPPSLKRYLRDCTLRL